MSDDIHPSERMDLFAEPVAEQQRLVDCDARLRAFADSKDVSRHVAGNINAGNAAFLRIGVNYHAPFCITFATKTFG